MKKYFLLSIVLLSFLLAPLSQAIAEVPKTLNYQGRLLDAKLEGLDQTLPITFELFDSEFGGQKLWGETQNVSIEKGYFNVQLGEDTPINLPFNKQYWLQVTVANESPYPRTALTQVPYAFRTITADTAEWALQLVDGALTISMMSNEARTVAGGDVIGTYPELYLRGGAVVDNIGQGEITQMMLSPNVTTPPSGPARGDLTGNYPDPLIAEGAVKTNRIADGAVTYAKLQPADGPVGTILGWDGTNWIETDVPTWEIDGVIGNEILDATVDGGLVRMGYGTEEDPYTLGIMDGGVTNDMLAGEITGDKLVDGTLGLNLMAPGQERGQVAWFDGTDWVLTREVLPNNTQVLKWVQNGQNWEMQWADDEFTVPYEFTGASKDNMGTGVTMLSLILDEADNSDQHVIYAEIDDEDGGSAIVGRNSGKIFDWGHLPVFDAEGTSDQAFQEGVIRGVANVTTIHNGGSTAGYFLHNATATSTVGSISTGVLAMNEIGNAINNTDHIGVLANVVAGGGDAWGSASIANGGAVNNIGAVGFATGANVNNWGVLGLSDSNPTTFFEGDDAAYTLPNSAAVIALSNQAGNDNVAFYAENVAENGRAAYIRGGGANATPLFQDPTDMDNATLVVYNPNSGQPGVPFATAIKTYGDIWANSAVGATQLVGLDKLTLTTGATTYNPADEATFGELSYEAGNFPGSSDNSVVWINDDALVQDNLIVVGPTTLSDLTVDNVQVNNNLNVDGITTLDETTVDVSLDVTGTLDVDGATTLNSTLDVDGATTLNNLLDVDGATTLNSTLDVDGATTLNSTLDVDGATTLNSTLTVTDVATFQNDVQIDTDLNVDGMTTLDETTVDGTLLTTGMATFNDDVQIDMELNVDGVTTLDETTVDGTLNVTGVATFNDDVQVDMDLNVDGATTLDETTVDGLLDVNGQLDVLNNALFQADVTVNGDLTVLGSTDLTDASIEELTIENRLDLGTNDAALHAVGANWDYVGGTWNLGAAPSPGISGDFLVSRGAGLSPVWTNSAANLGLGNLFVEDQIIIDAMPPAGATDVILNSNELRFDDADVIIGNSSGLRGNLTVGNDLTVDDESYLTNDVSVILGDFTVYTGVADIQNSIVNGATGTVVVDDNFNVTGTSDFDMDANFDADITGGLDNLVNINDALNVVGDADFDADITGGLDNLVNINDDLNVVGDADFDATITGGADNLVTIDDNLTVTGTSDFDMDANFDADIRGGLDNLVNINDDLNVVGDADFDATITGGADNLVTIDDNANVTGNLDVDGDAQFGTVAGDYVQLNTGVEFRTGGVAPYAGVNDNILASRGPGASPEWTSILSALTIDDLNVNNVLTLDADEDALPTDDVLNIRNGSIKVNNGDVTVSGETETNTLTVLKSAVIGDGGLDVDLVVSGDAEIWGAATIGSDDAGIDLIVDWDALIENNLNVNGVTTLGTGNAGTDLIVDYNATVEHNLTVQNDLEVTVNAQIGGTLDVAGYTDIDDSAIIRNDLDVLGAFDVTGLSDLRGNVTAHADVTLNTGDLLITANSSQISMNGINQQINMSGANAELNLTDPTSQINIYGTIVNTNAGAPVWINDFFRLTDADDVNEIFTSLDGDLTIAAVTDDMLVTAKAVQDALGNIPESGSGTTVTDTDSDGRNEVNLGGPLYANVVIDGNDIPDAGLVTGAAPYSVTFQDLASFSLATPTANITTTNTNISGLVTVTGNVVPGADATYDLGTNLMRWQDLYLDGASLHVGDVTGAEVMLNYGVVAANTASLNVDAIDVMTATATQVDFSQNVDANSGLDVTGASTFAGTIDQTGAANLVNFAGNVNAANGLDVTTAPLTVGGTAFAVSTTGVITSADDNTVNIDDNLDVTGTTNLQNTVTIEGVIEMGAAGAGNAYADFAGANGNLNVVIGSNPDANNGAISVRDAAGNSMAGMYLDVTTWYNGVGNTTDGAAFTYDPLATAAGLTVLEAGASVFSVDNNGDVAFDGTMTQAIGGGQVTFEGNVDAKAGLDVTGADLTVGTTLFTVDDLTGNTVVGGTLDARGIIFNGAAVAAPVAITDVDGIAITGNTTVDGTFTQTDNTNQATFQGNLDAQNGLDVTGANFTVGTTNFTVAQNGNTYTAGSLEVDGNVTLGDAVGDALTVNATSTFNEDVTVATANLTVGGTTSSDLFRTTNNYLVMGEALNTAYFNVWDGATAVMEIGRGGLGGVTDDYGILINERVTGTPRVGMGWNGADFVVGAGNPTAAGAGFEYNGGLPQLRIQSAPVTTTFQVSNAGVISSPNDSEVNIANALDVTGNVDANAGLDVTGANFTVGTTEFTVDVANGNTFTDGTLRVNGIADFRSDIVNGGGTVNVADDFAVTGTANLNSTTTLGTSTGAQGTLVFNDNDAVGAQTVTITAPDVTASYSITLPAAQGLVNQALVNDGTGQLNWATISNTLQQAYTSSPTPAAINLTANKQIQFNSAVDGTTLEINKSAGTGNAISMVATTSGTSALYVEQNSTVANSHAALFRYNDAAGTASNYSLVVESLNDNAPAVLIDHVGSGAAAKGMIVASDGNGIEVESFSGYALSVTDGAIKVSSGTVAAGAAIVIPTNVSHIVITDDGAAAANATSIAALAAGDAGRILYVTNNDAQPLTGTFPVNIGETWTYLWTGTAWHKIQ